VVDQPFTIFVFVSLNDQRTPGCGQTHVLKGGHIAMEEFFTWQTSTIGKAGSVCEGWSTEADRRRWAADPTRRRLDAALPSLVRRFFAEREETAVVAEDGERLPLPTPLLLGAGDAAIATFALPHAGSSNDLGPERQQMIFRFVPPELDKIKAGQPLTFPDWSPRDDGSWYPVSASECEAWRAQLLDNWRGWDGMREVAARERGRTEGKRAELRRLFRQHGDAEWSRMSSSGS